MHLSSPIEQLSSRCYEIYSKVFGIETSDSKSEARRTSSRHLILYIHTYIYTYILHINPFVVSETRQSPTRISFVGKSFVLSNMYVIFILTRFPLFRHCS